MNLLTWLSRRRFPYKPLITVEISRSRLLHNLEEFRKMAPKPAFAPQGSVAPVLKSNAYGHGALEVARILEKAAKENVEESGNGGIPFFIVDSYYEAVALRAGGIKTPILVIGYTRAETIAASRSKGTAFTVTSMETLESLVKSERPARVHLKIDTGMRRQGILPEEADKAIEIIKGNQSIVLEGICSHLCDADNADESFTEAQIHLWNHIAKKFKAEFPSMKYTHLSATDGHYFSHDIEANVSRLGIGLYGLSENPVFADKLGLLPVMEMKTIVTGVKHVKAGETVGYSRTFRAPADMTTATIPVGYFEGVDRRLSSGPDGAPRGFVQVGEKRVLCPIIGRVSMNITIVDVSKITALHVGDLAVVISPNAADQNSIVSMAKKCGTISYEIATHVPEHLRRVVVE
jgi:alanine racemase